MKSKNFNKKLVLNKETVFNLNNGEMNELRGGIIATRWPQWCETNEAACTEYCPKSVGGVGCM